MKKPLIFCCLVFFFALTYLLLSPGCSGGGSSSSKTNMFKDADADGYGDATAVKEFKTSKLAIDSATGFSTVADDDGTAYTSNDDDCDDSNASVSPGDTEVTGDGVDNDCDGSTDEEDGRGSASENESTDDDGDGYTEEQGDCDDSNNAYSPGATETDGDGIDNNCDGIDGTTSDADGDGVATSADCNDSDATVGAATAYYQDADSDGYGNPDVISSSCSAVTGYVTDATDCNDSSNTVNPGVTEGFFYGNGDLVRSSSSSLLRLRDRFEFIRTAHAADGDSSGHGNDIDDDCDETIDEGVCDCESLGLGHDHGNYTTSSLLNRFDFIRSAHAADGEGETSSEYYSADCAAQIDTFKSLGHYDCVATTDTAAPTTPTSTTTVYLEKLKFWVEIMDNSWARMTSDSEWGAIKLVIDFNSGNDFSCTFDTMDIDLPDGFKTQGGNDDFTVDLKSLESKGCLGDNPNWDNIQIANIDKIYFQPTSSGVTEWGLGKIHITGILSDTTQQKFYINEGVWAFVGNNSETHQYPKESESCVKSGAYNGFNSFDTIAQVDNSSSDYLNKKFPHATIVFTPNDWWVVVKISSPDVAWSGTLDHFYLSFDCGSWVEMRDLDRNQTRYMRFYTPNHGTNGSDFATVNTGIGGSDELKLDYLKIEAYQAWSTTGTRQTYKKEAGGSGSTIVTYSNSSDNYSATLTSGSETFD